MNGQPVTTDHVSPLAISPSLSIHERCRNFLAIDESENVVALCQSASGKMVLCLATLLAIIFPTMMDGPARPWWQLVLTVAAAAGVAYLPKYRAAMLFLGTYLLAFSAVPVSINAYASLVTFMLIAWTLLVLSRRYKTHVYARRPVVTLAVVDILLFATATYLPAGTLRSGLFSLVVHLTAYFWFLAYAIVDQRSPQRSPDLLELGVMQPFWGATTTPFGKGAAFLRKTLSITPGDLAVTQIKGVKLLIWANVLLATKMAFTWLYLEKLNFPTAAQTQAAFFSNQSYPILLSWASLVYELVNFSLWLSIYGHTIVGIARLAGFRLPRNTCRPLTSQTLAEFWNRYNYYFKELMVEFFYIPTFLKVFRKHPRVRMFFATFMAAGVGNMVYHFLQGIFLIESMGFEQTFIKFHASYIFYCVILAGAISISQFRAYSGFQPSSTLFGRLYSFLVIWGFIVCLTIFATESVTYSLGERLTFMASLFGVSW